MVGVAAGMAAAGKIRLPHHLQCLQQAEHLSRFVTRLLTLILMLKLPAATQVFQQVKTVLLISVLKISVLCVQFGMVVLNPADHYEMMAATKAAIEYNGPVYIRLGRLAVDSFNDPDTYTFELGKGITLHEGNDVAVIATGLVVNEALKAVKELEAEGINARLINIHTIKPIDRDIIIKAAKETGRIITVEEHNVIGGLGDAVCDVVSAECPVKVTKIGVNDRFGYSGPALELLDKFGLTQPHIAKVVRDVVKEDK